MALGSLRPLWLPLSLILFAKDHGWRAAEADTHPGALIDLILHGASLAGLARVYF